MGRGVYLSIGIIIAILVIAVPILLLSSIDTRIIVSGTQIRTKPVFFNATTDISVTNSSNTVRWNWIGQIVRSINSATGTLTFSNTSNVYVVRSGSSFTWNLPTALTALLPRNGSLPMTGDLNADNHDVTSIGELKWSDIALFRDSSILGSNIAGWVFQPFTQSAAAYAVVLAPKTGSNHVEFQLFRTADYKSVFEALEIGSDVNAVGEFALRSVMNGAGAVLRPLNFWMQNIKVFAMNTDYNFHVFRKLVLNGTSSLLEFDNVGQSVAGTGKVRMGARSGGGLSLKLGGSSDYYYIFDDDMNVIYRLSPNGQIKTYNTIQINNASSGAGTPLLGSNSPATVLSAPYTWLEFLAPDGTKVYVPAWK